MTEKDINRVYFERNLLALAFAELSHKTSRGTVGWYVDEDSPSWAVVFIDLDNMCGEVAWHIPRVMAEHSRLPEFNDVQWDGHTSEQKNGRMVEWLGIEDADDNWEYFGWLEYE